MPRKTVTTKTKGDRVQTQIYIDRELYDQVAAKAARDVRRFADAVRHALRLYVEEGA